MSVFRVFSAGTSQKPPLLRAFTAPECAKPRVLHGLGCPRGAKLTKKFKIDKDVSFSIIANETN